MPASQTADKGQEPRVQTLELHEYCQRRGWSVAGEYVDVGFSGAKETRPELDQLMADPHRRRFDAVLGWKFDRFATSVSHLIRALENFRSLGIDFISFSEQLDTSTPTGKMVFTRLSSRTKTTQRSSQDTRGLLLAETGSPLDCCVENCLAPKE